MEKIKDFIYEKSDLFFAFIIITLAAGIIFYSLNGWLFIEGENSNYVKHKTDITASNGDDKDTNTDDTKSNQDTSSADNTTSNNTSDQNNTSDNTDANKNTNTNAGTNAGADTKPDANANKNTNTKPDTNTNAGSNNSTKPDVNTNTKLDTNNKGNANTSTNSNTNASTKPSTNSNTNAGSNSQSSNGKVRNITIAPGSTAKSIANSLKNNGLITDEKAFVQTLIATKNDTKLKAGTFSIKQGSTTEEIIAILTK